MFEITAWGHNVPAQRACAVVFQHDYPPYTEPHPQTRLTMKTYEDDWVEIELFTCLGSDLATSHRGIHIGLQVVPGATPEMISDQVFQAAFVRGVKVVTRDRQGCWRAVALGSRFEERLVGCDLYAAADWASEQGHHLALPAVITPSSLPGVRIAGLADLWHPVVIR